MRAGTRIHWTSVLTHETQHAVDANQGMIFKYRNNEINGVPESEIRGDQRMNDNLSSRGKRLDLWGRKNHNGKTVVGWKDKPKIQFGPRTKQEYKNWVQQGCPRDFKSDYHSPFIPVITGKEARR